MKLSSPPLSVLKLMFGPRIAPHIRSIQVSWENIKVLASSLPKLNLVRTSRISKSQTVENTPGEWILLGYVVLLGVYAFFYLLSYFSRAPD